VYRFLERPLRSGVNAYLAAIEKNFARIDRMIAEIRSAGR
jgi:hypothetical protein